MCEKEWIRRKRGKEKRRKVKRSWRRRERAGCVMLGCLLRNSVQLLTRWLTKLMTSLLTGLALYSLPAVICVPPFLSVSSSNRRLLLSLSLGLALLAYLYPYSPALHSLYFILIFLFAPRLYYWDALVLLLHRCATGRLLTYRESSTISFSLFLPLRLSPSLSSSSSSSFFCPLLPPRSSHRTERRENPPLAP